MNRYRCDDCAWRGTLEEAHPRSHPGMVDCPDCYGEVNRIPNYTCQANLTCGWEGDKTVPGDIRGMSACPDCRGNVNYHGPTMYPEMFAYEIIQPAAPTD